MTTITLPRATVEQVLEALKDDQYRLVEVGPNQYEYKTDLAIAALERALAQQAEPVEPRRWEGDHNIESPFNACMHKSYCITLKQALAQRKPLSEEEIERICMTYQSPRQAARAVERAHKIGDNT